MSDLPEYIKNRLNNLDESPSNELWGKIEEKLPKDKNSKGILFYFMFLGLGILIGYLLFNTNYDPIIKGEKSTLKKTIDNATKNVLVVKDTKSKHKSNKTIIKETDDYIIYEECKQYTEYKRKKTNQALNTIKNNKNIITVSKKSKDISKANTAENKTAIINKGTLQNEIIKSNAIVKENIEIATDSDKTNSKVVNLKKKNEATEKTKEVKEKKLFSKENIIVAGYYSPTLYLKNGNGSSINNNFNGFDKKEILTHSYVIKFGFRDDTFGVTLSAGKLNLAYKTNLIKNNEKIINSLGNIKLENTSLNEINSTFSDSNNTYLYEELEYLEFPVEVYYTFFRKNKFGIDALGGLNFIYLQKNKLFLESEKVNKKYIGINENYLRASALINLGVNFHYKINKTVRIDVVPIYKYNLFSFKKQTDDFKPYNIGIQMGASLNF